MAALIPSQNVQYFSDEEKSRVIFEYIDKLLVLFPDFEYFHIHTYEVILEPNFQERKKLYSINAEIRKTMENLGYIEVPKNANAMHILTDKGRLAKLNGGHFQYLKSLKPKKDWFKIIPIILSIVFGFSTLAIGIWNINLNRNKDKSSIEKEQLYKQIDSLKNEIKILENKARRK